MALDPVLAKIPGLAGYLAQDQYSRGQEAQEMQTMRGAYALHEGLQRRRLEQEMRGAVASSGGDPAKAAQALVQMGTPDSIALAAKLRGMLPKPAEPFTLGPEQMRFGPNGEVIASGLGKDPKEKVTWGEPYQMGGAWVQRSSDGQIKQAVAREPQVRVTNEAPVTPVTIQDPKDPRGTIIIDGRTGKTLGKGPKMTEAGKIDAKTDLSMQGLGSDLQKAEDLLMGVARTSDGQVVKGNLPTGSGAGALYDSAAGFIGMSPSGAEEASSLKTVASRLISRIPRFEGPQSDKDVNEYKQAAGDAGNEKMPRARRLAAIRKMREIYAGYETGQKGRLVNSDRRDPGAPKPTVVDW